jgi:thymidylate synthase (FAD)
MEFVEPEIYLIAETKIDYEQLRQALDSVGKKTATDWYERTKGASKSDGELLTEVAGRICYDPETQILTDEGWKYPYELAGRELVSTWNWQEKKTEYQPYVLHTYPYKGRMLSVQEQQLDLLVTPEHRMYVQELHVKFEGDKYSGTYWTDWFITTAMAMNPAKRYRFLKEGMPLDGPSPKSIAIADAFGEQVVANQFGTYGTRVNVYRGMEIPIIPYLKLVGYYVSEGSIKEQEGSGGGIQLYQGYGLILDEMVATAKECGLPVSSFLDERNNTVNLNLGGGRAISAHFKKFGEHAEMKQIPRDVLSLDNKLLAILYHAMWQGDGRRSTGDDKVYHTTSERLADDVQEIWFRMGFASSITVSHYPDGRIMYRVARLEKRSSAIAKPHHRKWIHYDGLVWCVTTQNGIVYVRRNKKAAWCGNCYKSFGLGLNPNVTKIRQDSKEYLQNTLAKGDGSIFEHATCTFAFLNVSRVLTHELCRHRVGVAISQESLRFYRPTEISMWLPPEFRGKEAKIKSIVEIIESEYHDLEKSYDWNKMDFAIKKKITSALRRILPDGIATSMVWTANHRTIRHVITMRTAESAEVEIRYVFDKVARLMKERFPLIYDDFEYTELDDGTRSWKPKYVKV